MRNGEPDVVSLGDRPAVTAAIDVTCLEVLEVAALPPGDQPCHRSPPRLLSTAANSRSALATMGRSTSWPPTATAPSPRAVASANAPTTWRAYSTSSGVGLNT